MRSNAESDSSQWSVQTTQSAVPAWVNCAGMLRDRYPDRRGSCFFWLVSCHSLNSAEFASDWHAHASEGKELLKGGITKLLPFFLISMSGLRRQLRLLPEAADHW